MKEDTMKKFTDDIVIKEIIRKYETEEKSITDLSIEYNCHPTTIRTLLGDNRVKIRKGSIRTPKNIREEVVKLKKSGVSGLEIAKKLGLSKDNITNILKAANVVSRNNKFSEEKEKEIVEKFKNGETLNSLSREFAVCPETIRNIIKRYGLKFRNWGGIYKRLSPEEIEIFLDRWRSGLDRLMICEIYEISSAQLNRWLRQLGEQKRRIAPRGKEHGSWKGGELITSQGYKIIWLDTDDPYYCMATSQGYVLEHRLVMAKSLGRPLTKNETVHHISGNKLDNRIENLQLRQSNHGTGVVCQCEDCGSKNVKTTLLS